MSQTALALGGARSGKSRYAEALIAARAEAQALERVYLATAEARDGEMAERVAEHRQRRGPGWTLVEAPRDLGAALAAEARPGRAVLVDCLTLWLTNEMLADADLDAATERLLSALAAAPAPIMLVSNELGLGLVPETPLGRRFRDAQGRLNQAVAAAADVAVFVVAGLPMTLKGAPELWACGGASASAQHP